MNCVNCGAENASDSRFCISCGSPLSVSDAPVQPEPVYTEAADPDTIDASDAADTTETPKKKVDISAIKATFQDLLQKADPIVSKVKPYLKNKLVLGGIAGVLALVILISLISAIFFSGNGYIDFKQTVLARVVDGEVQVIIDKKVIDTGIEAASSYAAGISLDGKIVAFTTDENELYVLKGKKVTKVAEEVYAAELSVSGNGIAYLQRDGSTFSLTLYNVSSGKGTDICDEVSSTTFAISPDGKSVAFYVEGDENDELMYSKGKEAIRVTSKESTLMGLSNSGKYIYAVCESDDGEDILYSFNTKGDREKLGKIDRSYVRFNNDHTQIMFYNDDRTYISNKGKEGEKVVSATVGLVIAPNSSAYDYADNSTTYPVTSLYDHVYTGSDSNGNTAAWLVKKNADKTVKLVSKISNVKLDQSAKYLYYVYNGDSLRCLKISDGDSAGEKCKTIVDEYVTDYVITSNRSKAYYISDGSLYSVNGKKGGSAKRIATDDVDSYLAISGKDIVYYLVDGDLYACNNGKKGTKLLSDMYYIYGTPNGVVYAINSDAIYCTTGAKKLTKILELA